MEYISSHPEQLADASILRRNRRHSARKRSQSARVGIHGSPDRETDGAVAVSVDKPKRRILEVNSGREISVHRLGFAAMRLTGEGLWGAPKDRKGR